MRYEVVKVKRDSQTTYSNPTPPWAVPVLEEIFEAGNVERTGEFTAVDAEYPDPAAEYQRLCAAYGADPQTGTPFATIAYGNAGTGIRALAREIEAAKTADAVAEPRKGAKRKSTLLNRDPLLA